MTFVSGMKLWYRDVLMVTIRIMTKAKASNIRLKNRKA